jgi:hypothetical protein
MSDPACQENMDLWARIETLESTLLLLVPLVDQAEAMISAIDPSMARPFCRASAYLAGVLGHPLPGDPGVR